MDAMISSIFRHIPTDFVDDAFLRARQGKGRAEDLLAGLGPSFRDGEGSIPQGSVEIKEKGNAFHDSIIDHSRIARTYAN